MKIICATSSAVGHMDFGGKGFTQLAKCLQKKGHAVSWLSFGSQVKRLQTLNFDVSHSIELPKLMLRPLFCQTKIVNNLELHKQRIDALKQFYNRIKQEQADLILIDRLLVYAGLAVEQLNIPYIAIGTPGGYWGFEDYPQQSNVHAVSKKNSDYNEYTQCLKHALGWVKGSSASAWLNSPYLNITFMPKTFYPNFDTALHANIYHFQSIQNILKPSAFGLSFGNSGNQEALRTSLNFLVFNRADLLPIHVFVGHHKSLYKALDMEYSSNQIILHSWIDFKHDLTNLSGLMFLGGIGTIWHCINRGIPMFILPGYIGDQLENAKAIERLGIGQHLYDFDSESIKMMGYDNEKYINSIKTIRESKHYSDTMESACERIIHLTYQR